MRAKPAHGADFGADAVVATVIDVDPTAIDRLAALNPLFEQLRDSAQRRALGSRITLSDAAAFVGVSITDVLRAVNARSPVDCAARYKSTPTERAPDWMASYAEQDAAHVDVRPFIAADREPFTAVMTLAGSVPPDGVLIIDAPFNPLPLRDVLRGKGFSTFAREEARAHWRIFCRRDHADDVVAVTQTEQGARTWREANTVHIDVRHLEAPAPLVAILALVDSAGHEGRIMVHHHRDPLYLYPELLERGWTWQQEAAPPGEVRLLLKKSDGSPAAGE